MSKVVLRIILPLAGAAAALLAVELLGRSALKGLDHYYNLPFIGVQCSPPPGTEREQFLAEVQFLAGLPNRVDMRDDGLASRLREAFARHPWVESVEDVQISQQIVVQLRYRRPVLAVRSDGHLRAVDRSGILLPDTASTEGLPVYSGKATPSAGPAGTRWGDKAVEERARAVELDGNRKPF
jgi:hypothetical protein